MKNFFFPLLVAPLEEACAPLLEGLAICSGLVPAGIVAARCTGVPRGVPAPEAGKVAFRLTYWHHLFMSSVFWAWNRYSPPLTSLTRNTFGRF